MHLTILKLWHTWGWLFHISAWMIGGTALVCTYGSATASNTSEIIKIEQEHKDENLKERMAVQENTSKDINNNLQEIKMVQGKIFDRINQLADRQH